MSLTKELVAVGMPRFWGSAVGGSVANNLTVGAGNNSQALALQLTAAVNVVTTNSITASTGVAPPSGLEAGDTVLIRNGGANSMLVYPPGNGQINAGGASAGLAVAAGKNCTLTALDTPAANFIATISA